MRTPLAVLCLLAVASLAVGASATEGRHADFVDDPVLPPVAWNASLDAGYISTAPLVPEGMGIVVVKAGGIHIGPGPHAPAGLWAFKASSGELLWRANHTAADSGFETAPLLLVQPLARPGICDPAGPMVVTGWTSGQLTGHDLASGELRWSSETAAPSWGITGSGFADHENRIHWATETGALRACAKNGTIDWTYEDPAVRTYRAGLGLASDFAHIIQGTDEGKLLIHDRAGEAESLVVDLVALANLSGDWQIRATPTMLSPDLTLVHMKSGQETALLTLRLGDGSAPALTHLTMGASMTATALGDTLMLPISGNESGFTFWHAPGGEFAEMWRMNASSVTGEMGVVQLGEATGICLPQNTAAGSWRIAIDAEHAVDWTPDVTGYVTATCASSSTVLAAANDASWLEVRYDPMDYSQLVADLADLRYVEPTTSEPTPTAEPPESSIAVDEWVGGMVALLAVIGLLVSAHRNPNMEVRRALRAFAAIVAVLGIIIAGPAMQAWLATSAPAALPSERTEAHLAYAADWPDAWSSTSVSWHFPEDAMPEVCGAGGVVWLDAVSAETALTEELAPDARERPVPIGCVLIVGNLTVPSTVAELTDEAAAHAGFEVHDEAQVLGRFISGFGPTSGGELDRWWTYDVNGEYSLLSVENHEVRLGDHVDWHFDDSSV